MTESNQQQSISMVRAVVEKVLAKENSLSYASATDLAYFFHNIALVDEEQGPAGLMGFQPGPDSY